MKPKSVRGSNRDGPRQRTDSDPAPSTRLLVQQALRSNRENPRGISLALGGGGARGFAHVGVLKGLIDERIRIAELSGSSMGAIIASYYAVHGDLGPLEAFAHSLNRRTMLRYFDPCPPRYSLMKGKRLRRILTYWFGDLRIEDAKIPLSIVATNLRTGRSVVFRKGNIVDALMASSAIPGLLPAVNIRDEYYIDGGVSQPLPLNALRSRETLHVGIAVPALPDVPRRFATQPHLTEVLNLAYGFSRQYLQEQRHDTRILVLKECGTRRDTLAFHRSAEFLHRGENAAREAVPEIVKALRTSQKTRTGVSRLLTRS